VKERTMARQTKKQTAAQEQTSSRPDGAPGRVVVPMDQSPVLADVHKAVVELAVTVVELAASVARLTDAVRVKAPERPEAPPATRAERGPALPEDRPKVTAEVKQAPEATVEAVRAALLRAVQRVGEAKVRAALHLVARATRVADVADRSLYGPLIAAFDNLT
jgi:hypothetical protein